MVSDTSNAAVARTEFFRPRLAKRPANPPRPARSSAGLNGGWTHRLSVRFITFQLVVKRLQAYPQRLRGKFLVAVAFRQGVQNQAPLGVFQRRAVHDGVAIQGGNLIVG